MIKHEEGTHADGTIKYRYELTEEERDAGFVAFATGPITGEFAIGGNRYDCTEPHVAVLASDADELAWRIHKAHHANDRFLESPLPGDGSLEAYKQAVAEHTTHMGVGDDGQPEIKDGPAPATPAE